MYFGSLFSGLCPVALCPDGYFQVGIVSGAKCPEGFSPGDILEKFVVLYPLIWIFKNSLWAALLESLNYWPSALHSQYCVKLWAEPFCPPLKSLLAKTVWLFLSMTKSNLFNWIKNMLWKCRLEMVIFVGLEPASCQTTKILAYLCSKF